MKNFIKWLKSLFKKEKPVQVTPPVPTPVPTPVPSPVPMPVPPPAPKPVDPSDLLYEFRMPDGKSVWINDCKGVINPAWKPSMEALVFGGYFLPEVPGRKIVLSDPSNAPEGFPARSKEGYPLFYGIGGDGKPVGSPRVVFDGKTFESDAHIVKYIAAAAARDEALAEWRRQFEAQYYQGPVLAASMSQNDRAWFYVMSTRFRDLQVQVLGKIVNGDLHRTVLEGKNLDISRTVNDGELEHRHDSNPGTPDDKNLERIVNEILASVANGVVPPIAPSIQK